MLTNKSYFNFLRDLEYVQTILELSDLQMAEFLNVERSTYIRWKDDKISPSLEKVSFFYNLIYQKGIRLNKLKDELYKDFNNDKNIILFHGSRNGLIGNPTIKYGNENKDFGKGFYMGESFFNSASFVATSTSSSIYVGIFNKENTKIKTFDVSLKWMITIIFFRGKLDEYKNSNFVKEIIDELKDVDVIIAPTADNTMYSIIDDFSLGKITIDQALASLSANGLGKQYVFLNDNVLNNNLKIIDHLFLTKYEKDECIVKRNEESEIGRNKVKIALRMNAGKGKYIDELFE